MLKFSIFLGSPFFYNTKKQVAERLEDFQTTEEAWNIAEVPRSVTPHLQTKNYAHRLPPTQYSIIEGESQDEKILRRLMEIKVWPIFK